MPSNTSDVIVVELGEQTTIEAMGVLAHDQPFCQFKTFTGLEVSVSRAHALLAF